MLAFNVDVSPEFRHTHLPNTDINVSAFILLDSPLCPLTRRAEASVPLYVCNVATAPSVAEGFASTHWASALGQSWRGSPQSDDDGNEGRKVHFEYV
jgi:hypothetical protein